MVNEFVVYHGSIECLVGTFDGKRITYAGPMLHSYINRTVKDLVRAGYRLTPLRKNNAQVKTRKGQGRR